VVAPEDTYIALIIAVLAWVEGEVVMDTTLFPTAVV